MKTINPILSSLLQGARLPLLARPILSLGLRLGILRSDRLEAVLRYVETYDEAVNWWPPLGLILLSILLLLASPVLGISGIVELIRKVHPIWLGITELLLSTACLWAVPITLILHYRAKLAMLYRFAEEHRQQAEQLARASGRMLGDLGGEHLSPLLEQGSEALRSGLKHGASLGRRFRRGAKDRQDPD